MPQSLKIPNEGLVLLAGIGGKTGRWYARLLLREGYRVAGSDDKADPEIPDDIKNSPSFSMAAPGEIPDDAIAVTLTPGYPLSSRLISRAKRRDLLVFSEAEFAFHTMHKKNIQPRIAAITGTDGKSTVTALIAHLLKAAGIQAVAAGNIGTPLSELLFENKVPQAIALELSSYQLELFRNLYSHAALYLNLAGDHLDRYKSLSDYARTKWNIATGLRGPLIVDKSLLDEESVGGNTGRNARRHFSIPEIIAIDKSARRSQSFLITGNEIYFPDNMQQIADLSQLKLSGEHNYFNVLFALEAVYAIAGNLPIDEIREALYSFEPLPHRYQKFSVKNGITFIDDSKATTTQAAITAILADENPLYYFGGGRSKGEDYNLLAEALAQKNARVYLFGENAGELSAVISKHENLIPRVFKTLGEAVETAYADYKQTGDKEARFLLAPASTSWDQYANFEERGRDFQNTVRKL